MVQKNGARKFYFGRLLRCSARQMMPAWNIKSEGNYIKNESENEPIWAVMTIYQ